MKKLLMIVLVIGFTAACASHESKMMSSDSMMKNDKMMDSMEGDKMGAMEGMEKDKMMKKDKKTDKGMMSDGSM